MEQLDDIMDKGGERLATSVNDDHGLELTVDPTGSLAEGEPQNSVASAGKIISADAPLQAILQCAVWMSAGEHDPPCFECRACFAAKAVRDFVGETR